MGVDLSQVVGSGPGGRITREDVAAAAARGAAPSPTRVPSPSQHPSRSPSLPRSRTEPGRSRIEPQAETEGAAQPAATAEPSQEDTRRPMSRFRQDDRGQHGPELGGDPPRHHLRRHRRHPSPRDPVGTRRPPRRQDPARGSGGQGGDPRPRDLPRVQRHPRRRRPDRSRLPSHRDRGRHPRWAVGRGDPRRRSPRSVLELASEVRRLGEGAKARIARSRRVDAVRPSPSPTSAPSAAVTGHRSSPPATTAILSVGRAQEKAIVIDGELAIAPVMPLSLSYDHRVIDGGLGRRFISLVRENLEEPALFLAG